MRTVDDYIAILPPERQRICEYLRELVLETVPGVQEKLSFKIPFYHYHGMFMYFNDRKEGIDVAFCRGKDLVEAFPQLVQKERAIVATVCVTSMKDIATLEIRELVVAAASWNEEAKRLKIPMVKKVKKR